MIEWPNDADGDVFRSLKEQNFDFSKIYTIDYNIDFDKIPINSAVFSIIKELFPESEIVDHTDENPPYIQFKLKSKLNYEDVIDIQKNVSSAMEPFNGWCESWGVLH